MSETVTITSLLHYSSPCNTKYANFERFVGNFVYLQMPFKKDTDFLAVNFWGKKIHVYEWNMGQNRI
jgi:acyl-homoserine lactone acylase PvdQ